MESIIFFGSDFGAEYIAGGNLAGGCIIGDSNVFIDAEATCSGSYNKTSKTTFSIKGKSLK